MATSGRSQLASDGMTFHLSARQAILLTRGSFSTLKQSELRIECSTSKSRSAITLAGKETNLQPPHKQNQEPNNLAGHQWWYTACGSCTAKWYAPFRPVALRQVRITSIDSGTTLTTLVWTVVRRQQNLIQGTFGGSDIRVSPITLIGMTCRLQPRTAPSRTHEFTHDFTKAKLR